MPRQRSYPRFRSIDTEKEYLLVGTLMLSDVVPEAGEVNVLKMYQRLKVLIDNSRDWYNMETGRQLLVFPVPSGWAMCIEDEMKNVMDFKWLEKKAEKLSSGIVRLLKKEISDASSKQPGPSAEGIPS